MAVSELGQHVRIDGWLVRIDAGRWHWQSSLRRDDSGGGACELVYACAITRLQADHAQRCCSGRDARPRVPATKMPARLASSPSHCCGETGTSNSAASSR